MATVGQTLTVPESGWQRIEDSNVNIMYSSNTTAVTGSAAVYSNGTAKSIKSASGAAYFNFIGTKLRIIISSGTSGVSTAVSVSIDNVVVGTFSAITGVATNICLIFEKTGLTQGEHFVRITNTDGTNAFVFDAIDIDDSGSIKPYAVFFNRIKNSIYQMIVGDAIPCKYTVTTFNVFGSFSALGTSTDGELPLPGVGSTSSGTFYFILVGYTPDGRLKLVADRNIQNIAWDVLNTAGMTIGSGVPMIIDGKSGYTMRILGGGINTGSDKDNEWDNIFNSTLNGTINALDATVWNPGNNMSWVSSSYSLAGSKILRGGSAGLGSAASAASASTYGFRPVLIAPSSNKPPILIKTINDECYGMA